MENIIHGSKNCQSCWTKDLNVNCLQTKRRSASLHGASNLRRTGASVRARSKSPLNGPWVPPPGKSTKSSMYSWQVGAVLLLSLAQCCLLMSAEVGCWVVLAGEMWVTG